MSIIINTQKKINQRNKPQLAYQQGFTLVELMISLGLGLLVVALVGTLYASNSDVFRFQRAQGENQEKARYVLGYLRQNLQQIGYHRDGVNFQNNPQSEALFEQNAVISRQSNETGIIYRYQKASDLRNCAGEQILPDTQGPQGQFVSVIDKIELTNKDALVCYPSVTGVNNPSTQSAFEVAKGIHQLQFKYGVDTTDDFLIDEYKNLPTGNDWLNTHAVSVCLLLASETKLPLVKKSMVQNFTDCVGVPLSSEDFADANGFAPVMYVVRTTIYLPNTYTNPIL